MGEINKELEESQEASIQRIIDIGGEPDFSEEPQDNSFGSINNFRKAIFLPERRKLDPRHVARSVSRAAETFTGMAGNIAAIPGAVADFASQKAGNPSREEILAAGSEPLGESPEQNQDIKLPTINDIRNVSEGLFGEFVKPQNETEEFYDEVVSDATAFLMFEGTGGPGAKPLKAMVKLLKPLLLSLGSNGAAKAGEAFGLSKEAQQAIKFGTAVFGNVAFEASAKVLGGSLYNAAEGALAEGAEAVAPQALNRLRAFKKELLADGSSSATTPIFKRVKELEANFKENGKIGIKVLQNAKRNLNSAFRELYNELNLLKGDPSVKKALTSNVDKFRSIIKDPIAAYGKANPAFGKPWQDAEEVYAAIAQSDKIKDFLKVLPKKYPAVAGTLSTLGFINRAVIGPSFAKAVAPAYLGYKALQVTSRMMNSPVLAKHYFDVLIAAVKGSTGLAVKSLLSLEKAAEKEGTDLTEENPDVKGFFN